VSKSPIFCPNSYELSAARHGSRLVLDEKGSILDVAKYWTGL
jgi:hypothetical protein